MMAREPNRTGSTECFYVDADGRKQDAALHADMLGDDRIRDPEATRALAKRFGLDDRAIEMLYGVPPR
jgi:hypothetical protein